MSSQTRPLKQSDGSDDKAPVLLMDPVKISEPKPTTEATTFVSGNTTSVLQLIDIETASEFKDALAKLEVLATIEPLD